jgi:hypothetical protein
MLRVRCCVTFGLKCCFSIVLGQFQKYPQHFIFIAVDHIHKDRDAVFVKFSFNS